MIEAQLAWPIDSKHWKQRDYLNLITALENKTGISLSLSTVKRIWSENYKGNPHPATLDALAKFLEYENWLKFQESQIGATLATSSNTQQAVSAPPDKTKKVRWLLLILLVGIAIASFLMLRGNEGSGKSGLSFDKKEVSFSAVNAEPNGVPNTVIFKFDLTNIEADSFFIQQSWNPLNREKISKTDSILTSIYYYPGIHTATLIANDSIIKETTLKINSAGWIATADYGMTDPIPIYIPLDIVKDKHKLHITTNKLSLQNVSVQKNLQVNYIYVDEFDEISGDNFVLSVNLNADSIFNLTCPSIGLMVIGTKEMHAISLRDKGCAHKIQVKFGEKMLSGKNSDLSGLGVNVYDTQQIRMDVKEKTSKIYLNDQFILESAYTESIGDIKGFCFFFSGTGQVNSIKLNNKTDGRLMFNY